MFNLTISLYNYKINKNKNKKIINDYKNKI